MTKQCNDYTDAELIKLVKKNGSINNAAISIGIGKSTLKDRMKRIVSTAFGTKQIAKPVKIKPARNTVKRFIFTSAQDDTAVHKPFLENLLAYCKYTGAELHIGGYTYQKALFEDHRTNTAVYHPLIEKYMTNRRFEVGEGLLFCGEMNTLPTAVNPLSGFETYTRSKWGIFPHPRVSMVSVPTMRAATDKIIMTTGSITLPNYVHKKAGIKAEFHHVIGAVMVELDSKGDFFCRHILADDSGDFQDLTTLVKNGAISEGHDIEAATWGDIHFEQMDLDIVKAVWGYTEGLKTKNQEGMKTIIDTLRPKYQFFHDVSDFRPRNHHRISDPHFQYKMYVKGVETIDRHMLGIARFLKIAERPWCQSYVVESNHDLALKRWLKEADYRYDPVNAIFFLEAQLAVYKAILADQEDFSILEHILRNKRYLAYTQFLRTEESMMTCPWAGGGIENAIHGHQGANGARGSISQFARMGSKANVAHTHSAAILEGVWQAGTFSKLLMDYNKGGMSSWNHSFIITYCNGKRAIITMRGKKWRA